MKTKPENAIYQACMDAGLQAGGLVLMNDGRIYYCVCANANFIKLIKHDLCASCICEVDHIPKATALWSSWPIAIQRPRIALDEQAWTIYHEGNTFINYPEEKPEIKMDYYDTKHIGRIEKHLEQSLVFIRELKTKLGVK